MQWSGAAAVQKTFRSSRMPDKILPYQAVFFRGNCYARDLFPSWNEIEHVRIQEDRRVILSKTGSAHHSPVVFGGDQAQLLESVQTFIPERQQ